MKIILFHSADDLKEFSSYSIFGSGETARDLLNAKVLCEDRLKAVIDRSGGGTLAGRTVITASQYADCFDEADPIVIASCFWKEIIDREVWLQQRQVLAPSSFLMYQNSELASLDGFYLSTSRVRRAQDRITNARLLFKDHKSTSIFDAHLSTRTSPVASKEAAHFENLALRGIQYFDFGIEFERIVAAVDVGAFGGDETSYMLAEFPRIDAIHVFEPNRESLVDGPHFKRMTSDVRVKVNFCALGAGEGQMDIKLAESQSKLSTASEGPEDTLISVLTFDSYWKACEKFDFQFFKLDVEGFELDVLKGALAALTSCRPIIAMSIYHRDSDFYELPLWCAENFSDSTFEMRNYTNSLVDTILYVIPNEFFR